VKGLTRTGRQVSEDPDLDNLLSTLSPEEMEELEKDMMKVPDLNPEDGKVIVQGDNMSNNLGDAKVRSDRKGRLSKREQSFEDTSARATASHSKPDGEEQIKHSASLLAANGEPKKESRKQEYLRRMGLSQDQEGDDDAKGGLRPQGSLSAERVSKLDDRSGKRAENFREERSRLSAREKERKSENFRTQGLVSRMLEKSKVQESQAPEERKPTAEEKSNKAQRQPSERGEGQEKKVEKRSETEKLTNRSGSVKKREKTLNAEKTDDGTSKGRVIRDEKSEKVGNCVATTTPNSKAKVEEEEEDEDSSMFDELMEQVQNNDPSLSELNVNNSEVIKTKTLIEFAQALHDNSHVKTFALANCRADDHVAYAIANMLRNNKTITSINLDSNHLTGKGILSLIQALLRNSTLTELRFQNQRHICGGKTEMEMAKILKENTTLLKLGYHFELAGPRMTTTNILSRNMDRQRQKRLQEQKQAQANGEKKVTLEVPKTSGGGSWRGSPKASPKASPAPSPIPSPKMTPKRGAAGPAPPPPPPPPGGGPPPPPPPPMDVDALRNSLTPVSQRKLNGKGPGDSKNSRDQLLASIRGSDVKQLKKVPVPKWLQ
uniref:Leiomodin-1 n=1 Tax=Tetraodon nigroviridis TaxID=99883 RepID=H3CNL0_TETNG